jgi:hypothetical protein
VFPSRLGRQMEPRDFLFSHFRPLLVAAGPPPITFMR